MSPRLKGNSNLPYILIGGTFVLYLIIKLAIPQITIWVQANWVLAIAILAIAILLSILGVILYFKYRPSIGEVAAEYKAEDNSTAVTYKPRRTPIPTDMKRLVIHRAERRCQWVTHSGRCTMEGNLKMHHIDGNPSKHNMNNLIYLCPNHHDEAHAYGARRLELQDWASGRYSA